MNTAIEVDLGGNVNSTHVMGKTLMNGIWRLKNGLTAKRLPVNFFVPVDHGGGPSIVPLASHMWTTANTGTGHCHRTWRRRSAQRPD